MQRVYMSRSARPQPLIRSVSFLLVIAVLACNAVDAGLRSAPASRFVDKASSAARSHFSSVGKFGGGVLSSGTAKFFGPDENALSVRDLKLTVLDEAKLRNDQPDYDAIGIRWNGNVYELTIQDNLVYPTMQFVRRGGDLVYTIPVAGGDDEYFKENKLEPAADHTVSLIGGTFTPYVAKEFHSDEHISFLERIDVGNEITLEEMPSEIKASILEDLRKDVNREDVDPSRGSYVNADFHVTYRVLLENEGDQGNKSANVEGVPLRYYWKSAGGNAVAVWDIDVFAFPEKEMNLQYRAIAFFQSAAILRAFHSRNEEEFGRFMRKLRQIADNN